MLALMSNDITKSHIIEGKVMQKGTVGIYHVCASEEKDCICSMAQAHYKHKFIHRDLPTTLSCFKT